MSGRKRMNNIELKSRFDKIDFAPPGPEILGKILDNMMAHQGYEMTPEERERLIQEAQKTADKSGARALNDLVKRWPEIQHQWRLADDLADFSPALKKDTPAPRPLCFGVGKM